MSEEPMAKAVAVLEQHWGYTKFRPAQAEVIQAVLNGDDVLAVLATGYGKSVCFQIPAVMCDGCTLVVSPLIALMKDQVDAAKRAGISASFVNSHVDPDIQGERLAGLRNGEYDLFYVAPERMRSRSFRDALLDSDINLIAIDEAHCASMWGHDFRPAYSRLHEISSLLFAAKGKRPPILAVTATATNDIEDDIATSLGMVDEYVRVVGDPVRPNLHYQVETPYGSEWGCVLNFAKQRFHIAGRHLIYAGTRKATAIVRDMILGRRDGRQEHAPIVPESCVETYHGGMNKEDRTDVQDRFIAGSVRIVCATNAFGMGIDVPDIRTVIHMGVPGSLEAYVQETGRAGRDGKDARVVLVESKFAVEMQEGFIDRANPPMPFYAQTWDWMNATIQQGQVLRLSAGDIAMRIAKATGQEIDSGALGTVLNVMEAHGLIEREYYDGGCPVEIDIEAAEEAMVSLKGKPAQVKVLAELRERAITKLGAMKGVCVLHIEKEDVAVDAGVSRSSVDAALRNLDADDVLDVGRVFTGKTTKMKRPGAVLEDVLPIEELQAKRERDFERFGYMMSYTSAPDPKQFIRDYFKGQLDRQSRRRKASE